MSSDRMQGIYDTRYDGIYQRGGAAEPGVRAAVAEPARFPVQQHADRPDDAPAGSSVIREVGAEPETQHEPAPRQGNPFDVWLWVVSAVLVALGVFFVSAPMLYAERAEVIASTTYYSSPWFNYTVMLAPALILLGAATAVVQLFVLSIRHTLRTR
ncbi:hypothetical protein FJV46_01790 [Arthrobacter agilis]|uniref:hypothetical protein n=1 Tax=Arthrobacter agilis TaxID=37921 RepID=UPI000B3542A7|nr:hypothetical protein [Arthrobacter agilis]OUM40609.1 hypothetical protein B8W74_14025 [Arthrobacter agilis]PPB45220.1 hypothetical protein CI784_14055 [Arthrobacter agilis]TPV27923.1 hypothetical protein FJV46_01790 [Arthrobacter agilis]VDR31395.1 Uncharacterised protein [Arthrobacter agilis]